MSVPLAVAFALCISASASSPWAPPDPAPVAITATAATTPPAPTSAPLIPDALKAPVAAPLPPDSAMIRTTRNAIQGLNTGHFLTSASLWTIPGVYDIGFLTMMGSKKTLKNEYVKRYHEDPTEYGQTGDDAYWQGWAMKGGAVVSFIVLANMDQLGLGMISFVILGLGGGMKHYEASRMLYEQSRHYENGILDEDPPIIGKDKGGDRERFIFRYSTAF